jgi:hypothetical protein
MIKKNRNVYSNDELKIGSDYFEYHFRMYAETYIWLSKNKDNDFWNTERNAFIDAHLIHARALINFLGVPPTNNRWKTDMYALDFFHDCPELFSPISNQFLSEQSKNIGGKLVHITKNAIPNLKSQQHWPITTMAFEIIESIEKFLNVVPETRLENDVKKSSNSLISQLKNSIRNTITPFSVNVST